MEVFNWQACCLQWSFGVPRAVALELVNPGWRRAVPNFSAAICKLYHSILEDIFLESKCYCYPFISQLVIKECLVSVVRRSDAIP